ncbi:1-phosphofructokinase [Alkalihalobacillus oceani]|uniref:Tagatose-6-phosphate kinase n=1 Tax=Halalkalibacter oceani TaxID=1653776 RepID=A0A9X2DPM8_9BACI|nr:1-phosphofructokinase [Halalkalibacter oceani]MCM3714153.1 1-phosphofructokinase [Halalkalibacter oceani]
MIYTVTLNPALDYFVRVDEVKIGLVNRSAADRKEPGGKGINVSRVLKRLGHHSEALGFIGGFTGEYVKNVVEQEDIGTNFTTVEGDTRINIKIKGHEETEINGVSPVISERALSRLYEQLAALSPGDALVLAGSVPESLPLEIYKTMTAEAQAKGAEVFVDTSGEPLRQVLEAKPTFIKPNHHELGELFDTVISAPEQALPYIRQLHERGIHYVLVSFAGKGALLGADGQIFAASPPKGTVKNSVGAGDSVVAGFLAAQKEGRSLKEAFCFAVAAGSATAFSSTFCRLEEVERLARTIDASIWEG